MVSHSDLAAGADGGTLDGGGDDLALIGLMPPVMLIALSNTPERTTAEIIRDVAAGRSL